VAYFLGQPAYTPQCGGVARRHPSNKIRQSLATVFLMLLYIPVDSKQ